MEPDRQAAPPSPPIDPAPPSDGGALARLRERVEAAVQEILRLRQENTRLAERVAEIGDASGPGLQLGDRDPAELRASIQGFIDAVDAALAAELDKSR
ncbi:hypothetical protein [Rubricoccus marinus]|uniref:Uncharacterized protein n=1 Tax=Rubricoccus marinus TaxID=716817 RepID=A0A259TV01_9BACT|nr:hypothetical protein [Rubricoccus marinus]OZC01573.1 hypothetical protein BSZ36_00370 [Rubricoccus marinus]